MQTYRRKQTRKFFFSQLQNPENTGFVGDRGRASVNSVCFFFFFVYQFNFKFYSQLRLIFIIRYILFNLESIQALNFHFPFAQKKRNQHWKLFRHWIALTMSLTLIRFVVDFKFPLFLLLLLLLLFFSLCKPIFVHWMTFKYTHDSLLDSDLQSIHIQFTF